MAYQVFAPPRALQPFVEKFGIQASSEPSRVPTTVLPCGSIELLVHFGDPFHRLEHGGFKTEPDSYITGQRTAPLQVGAEGRTGILICSFYPWGLSAFTDMPISHLTDQSVDLAEIFPDAGQLTTLVRESSSDLDRIRQLESFLLARLKAAHCDHLVQLAVFKLGAQQENLSVQSLADQSGLSKRQLDRRFKHAVGITTKQFVSVVRFQKALARIRSGESLGYVAQECGYFDQSHMNRSILKYSGISPGKLILDCKDSPLMRQFNRRLEGREKGSAERSTERSTEISANKDATHMSHFYKTLYLQ